MSWWIDSDAAAHVANSLYGFVTTQIKTQGARKLKGTNGFQVDVETAGSLALELHTSSKLQSNNGLYVYTVSRNLVFVSCLDDNMYECMFDNKQFVLNKRSKNVGLGVRRGEIIHVIG